MPEQLRPLDDLRLQCIGEVRQQIVVRRRIYALVLVAEIDLVQMNLVLGVVTVRSALLVGAVEIVLTVIVLKVSGETLCVDIGQLVVAGLQKEWKPPDLFESQVRVADLHVVAAVFVP